MRRICAMDHDQEALADRKLAELLAEHPGEGSVFNEPIEAGRRAPKGWAELRPQEAARRFRRSLRLTQDELARRAGIPRSQVVRFEAGQDVRLSTLRRIYAAFGCGFVVLPRSDRSVEELRGALTVERETRPRR